MSKICLTLITLVAVIGSQNCICAFGVQDNAATTSNQRQISVESSREIIENVMADEKIPGVSVAIQKGDELIWAQGFGLCDLSNSVPVTTDTKFRLGSVSKILTASLAAKLAEAKRVDLDRDIREYLADLPDNYQGITLRHLLGHLGGIRHYRAKDFNRRAPGGMIDLRFYRSTDDALELFIADPPIAKPGEKYSYSTFGYTLISAVLEAATETSFPELLAVELFEPLKLQATTTDDFRKVIPNRTSFYDRRPDKTIVRSYPVNAAYKFAGGGLLSTATDLVKFGAAHFEAGFLSDTTLQELFTAQKTNDGKELGLGLGWRLGKDDSGRRIAHHAGSMAGCRAVLVIYPEQKLSIAILTNLATRPSLKIEKLAMQIADGFFLAIKN